jgi:hypothetical protein
MLEDSWPEAFKCVEELLALVVEWLKSVLLATCWLRYQNTLDLRQEAWALTACHFHFQEFFFQYIQVLECFGNIFAVCAGLHSVR